MVDFSSHPTCLSSNLCLNCSIQIHVSLFYSHLLTSSIRSLGGLIPDAAAIHAARKRRQAARERGEDPAAAATGGGPKDYISLEDQKRPVKGRGSRLVEEEEDDRDPSDEERISFTGKINTLTSSIKERFY